MTRAPSIAGVILAAGASSRMGTDKALLPWHGDTFLGAHIEALTAETELVIVVAGANFEQLEPIVYAHGAFIIQNPTPELGQFSSLQAGLREVLNHGRDAAMIALVDRPPAAPNTLAAIHAGFLAALEDDKWAVAPEFEGAHGHPIIASREMISALVGAPATSNARDVMHAHADKIEYVPVTDARVVMNVDTPEQYEQLSH